MALLVCATGAVLAAPPPLETHATESTSIALPRNWKVTATSTDATVFIARQRIGSAAMIVSVQLTGNTSTEDQLLDRVARHITKDLRIAKRTAMTGGGHMLLGDGMAGTTAVRVGAIAVATGTAAVFGVLIAKPAEFESLGGIALVVEVLASVQSTKHVQ